MSEQGFIRDREFLDRIVRHDDYDAGLRALESWRAGALVTWGQTDAAAAESIKLEALLRKTILAYRCASTIERAATENAIVTALIDAIGYSVADSVARGGDLKAIVDKINGRILGIVSDIIRDAGLRELIEQVCREKGIALT